MPVRVPIACITEYYWIRFNIFSCRLFYPADPALYINIHISTAACRKWRNETIFIIIASCCKFNIRAATKLEPSSTVSGGRRSYNLLFV